MHVITTSDDPALAALIAYDVKVIELFAGPGGMSEAMKLAGLNPRAILGIEHDRAACDTATAAGHPRYLADIAALSPRAFGRAWGIHGSPPCQGFSMAGKGLSRGDTDHLLWAIAEMGRGVDPDVVMAKLREVCKSPLSALSLEPLRWILELEPEWFTLEQVPAVLPLWEAYAEVLRPRGYFVWTGKVHAEQYGVPQTRIRAVAFGSRTRDVSAGMTPTHSRFYTHKAKRGQLDPGVLPYVTMAEALEWGDDRVIRSNHGTGGDPAARGERNGDQPAATVTSKVGRNKVYVAGNQANAAVRNGDEPAPAIAFGHNAARHQWSMGDVRNSHGAVRNGDEPAATITSSMDNGNFRFVPNREAVRDMLEAHPERINNQSGSDFDLAWPADQPAPAVAGRGLVGMPGANANRFNGSTKSRNDGVRVTVQEAGVLQSFPADYPWRGTQTQQYQQAGNAVPPLLGQAMIETVLGRR